MVRFVCETCGKVVERAANGARVFRFCAKRCQRFRDGDRVIRGGYWLVRVPMLERKALHIRAHRRRKHRAWMPEHIVVAERALGRALGRGEVVHHINCDRLDNRPSNLLICDRAYHAWLHGEMSRRYAHEHFGRVA